MVDPVADHCFAPTNESGDLIKNKGTPKERIYVTGTNIFDAVFLIRELAAERIEIIEGLGNTGDWLVLVTPQCAKNVDASEQFSIPFRGFDFW